MAPLDPTVLPPLEMYTAPPVCAAPPPAWIEIAPPISVDFPATSLMFPDSPVLEDPVLICKEEEPAEAKVLTWMLPLVADTCPSFPLVISTFPDEPSCDVPEIS